MPLIVVPHSLVDLAVAVLFDAVYFLRKLITKLQTGDGSGLVGLNTNAFVTRLIENRHLTLDEALDVAQGQIVTGKDALDMKMIDGVGGFYDVVEDISKAANIEKPQVVYLRPESKLKLPGLNLGLLTKLSELTKGELR